MKSCSIKLVCYNVLTRKCLSYILRSIKWLIECIFTIHCSTSTWFLHYIYFKGYALPCSWDKSLNIGSCMLQIFCKVHSFTFDRLNRMQYAAVCLRHEVHHDTLISRSSLSWVWFLWFLYHTKFAKILVG